MTARFWMIAALLALMCTTALPASAHPLGNFTINHLTKLSVRERRVEIRYVLDMAEIPTYQALRAETVDGKMTASQLAAFGRKEATLMLPQLRLTVDGAARSLTVLDVRATTKPGAGGLPTFYMTLDAGADISAPPSHHRFTFTDDTFAGRLGWHDVVVAPAAEPTHELTAYPSALLGSPRAVTNVAVAYDRSGRAIVRNAAPAAIESGSVPAPSQARSNQLSDMLARGTGSWTFVLLTLLVAIALGALHALEPGHGKTLLAISLVGARATVKQAAILASALTVAHTLGVLALGIAISLFKGYFVPEAIYPWITLASGTVIAIIGARAVQRQIAARQPVAHAHAHGHAATHPHEHAHVHVASAHAHVAGAHVHDLGAHVHDAGAHVHDAGAHVHDAGDGHARSHGHSHGHDDIEHARSHAIPGTAPLTFGGTVWAAMSGGVAPCPAALVVLLAAVALDQVAYGIFVIVAFSFGLAATLTGLGIAVVRGATWLQGRPQFERFVTYGPLVSAIVISTIGAIMVGQGFAQQGISLSPLAITAIVALAILGYAFAHPFAHRRVEAT